MGKTGKIGPMGGFVGLALLGCALYAPGLAVLPPVDRDESLYAQAARQMAAGGGVVVPRVGDTPRLIKPPGIYWLQAAFVLLAGKPSLPAPAGMIAHRLPSAAGALAAVLGTYVIGRRWLAPPAALLGAALLCASALLVVEAHLATTDTALLACVVAAQACLAAVLAAGRLGRRPHPSAVLGFWLAQIAGILIKGPVAPLVSTLTLATLSFTGSRRNRANGHGLLAGLRPAWGMALVTACLLPWLFALTGSVGWRALPSAMAGDIVPKLVGAHESHSGPPGFHLLLAPATFWPGSVVLALALAHGWRRRHRPAERFLLAWLVPTWIFFECLPTKLPHYVLPALPALALLAGRGALSVGARPRARSHRVLLRAAVCGWGVIPVALAAAVAIAAARLEAAPPVLVTTLVAFLLAGATSILCVRHCWRADFGRAAVAGIAGAVLFYALLLQAILPRLDGLWLSRRLAATLADLGSARPVLAVGYAEPSLMLLVAPRVRAADPESTAAALANEPNQWAAVADAQLSAFRVAAAARGLNVHAQAVVQGLDYTHGRRIGVTIFAAAEAPRGP